MVKGHPGVGSKRIRDLNKANWSPKTRAYRPVRARATRGTKRDQRLNPVTNLTEGQPPPNRGLKNCKPRCKTQSIEKRSQKRPIFPSSIVLGGGKGGDFA